ncbi:MAG: biotin transporter BioY, partial [Holosporales bacterium]|nr:biotin transporter BioY [Holosporales bacterium]
MQIAKGKTVDIGLAVVRVILGALFIAVCSQITIPWWPVPFTMQTFAVMTLALLMQENYIESSITGLVYVAAGAFGLPVFAGASHGVGVLVSPTGGYIIGFVMAMWLI